MRLDIAHGVSQQTVETMTSQTGAIETIEEGSLTAAALHVGHEFKKREGQEVEQES